jgi:hypothetical protein
MALVQKWGTNGPTMVNISNSIYMGVCLKMGIPNSWMVYKGNSICIYLILLKGTWLFSWGAVLNRGAVWFLTGNEKV